MTNHLDDLSKDELKKLILSYEKQYGLVWEDEPDDKFKLLSNQTPHIREKVKLKIGNYENKPTHSLICGDNSHALKALQETHLDKIDVIYIDPPYNTGNKDFVYNDHYVDSKNSYRHSQWLSFMKPRLELAYTLLSEDGVMFVSIDDNEQPRLRLLLDSIFGNKNFVGNMIWKCRTGSNDAKTNFSNDHEYILVYAKNIGSFKFVGREKDYSGYTNPDNDPKGIWRADNPTAASGNEKMKFPIRNPFTHEVYVPPANRYWAFSQLRVEEWTKSGKMVFPKVIGKRFVLKKYAAELKSTQLPFKSLHFSVDETILTQKGTKLMKSILGSEHYFKYAKPVELIEKIIQTYPKKDITVLDFFAGSGTTGHAVINLNENDQGKREFILVTDSGKSDDDSNSSHIAKDIAYERIKRVLTGENWADNKTHPKLEQNFKYSDIQLGSCVG